MIMDCEEFKDKIIDYFSNDDLSDGLEDEIGNHILSCDECNNIYLLSKALNTASELNISPDKAIDRFVLRKLNEAESLRKEEKYDEAIECLEDALIVKPDDEEIRDHIEALENQLVSKAFNVIVDGEEKVVKWVGEYIEKIYHATKNIVVKFSGQELIRMERIPSFGFQDKDEGSYSYEGDDFTVEIRKGMYEDLLIIRPKRSGK